MRPRSGFTSPSAIFRRVDLPTPATPKTALVSPRATSKETPSSTWLPSNSMETSSKTTALWCDSWGVSAPCWLVRSSAISVREEDHQHPGDKEVQDQDEHRRCHHRLSGGAADALCSALGRQTVVAADAGDDEAEE